MATMLVTGSSGLIGSEVVSYFSALGWSVHGADNNMRADLFGPEGDTTGIGGGSSGLSRIRAS